jgi:ribonuclease VapC
MVIDTSALLAILLNEPERSNFIRRIASEQVRVISAASVIEAGMRLHALKGPLAVGQMELFLQRSGVEIAPLDAFQVPLALRAFERYGKGRHPAGLNFGDCLSYALAKMRGDVLLFKGDDFAKTDLA